MYTYRTLENTAIGTLHKAFLKAFSDYQVKMDLPVGKFEQMLARRGYSADISMGAFDKDDMVGFILNGLRRWNDKLTVYDTGTGVIPEYRHKGITSSIFVNIAQLLKKKGVEQYLLEVIKNNTKAFELYNKQGFEVVREFSCYQEHKSRLKQVQTFTVENVDKFEENDWKQCISFWDIEPSWQNSVDSVNAVPDAFNYSIVYVNNKIAGYGIIDKKTGDIPQIAVRKDCRGKGIGTSIAADLINNTGSEKISILNVDNKNITVNTFIKKLGFKFILEQYEMILIL